MPGLAFTEELPPLTRKGGSEGEILLAGLTAAKGPTLLPAGLLERLPAIPQRDDPVKVGNLDAYRYRDLQPDPGGGRVTLYVAPTTRGVGRPSPARLPRPIPAPSFRHASR